MTVTQRFLCWILPAGVLVAASLVTVEMAAQFSYNTIGGTYTQDFNSILVPTVPVNNTVQSSPALPTGWAFIETGANADLQYRVHTGASNTGDTYLFGLSGNAERALGSLLSGSLVSRYGFYFTNNTGQTINSIALQYTGETWRVGAASRVDRLDFQYSTDATTVNTGTWTDVNALDYANPGQATGSGTLQHSAVISHTITGLCLANGASLFLRWVDTDAPASADDGMGIDDFSITCTTVPTVVVNTSLFNGAFGNVVVGNSSASSSFTVSGCSLTNDLLITPPTGFEIRTGANPFGTAAINLGSGTVSSTTIDVRFTPLAAVAYSDNVVCSSIGATSQNVPVTGTGEAANPPTKLAITSINGGSNVIENTAFSITVQAQDNGNNPQNVTADTDVLISRDQGSFNLGGTLTGTILAGTSSVVINGLTYDAYDTGVVLKAERTAGDVLTDAFSNPFDVLGAAQDFGFTATPVAGVVNTIVGNIEVSALRWDANIATEFSGPVTISISSGPGGGSMLGTLTQNAVNGTATFTGISFDAVGNYILQATGSLNTGLSTQIIITNVPSMTELVVPQFIGSKSGASSNTNRTPLAACLQFDNLEPNQVYKLGLGMALTSDAATSTGAGNVWDGTAFNGSTVNNAFTTDANGSSGPVWVFLETTGNSTRFGGGQVHDLRVRYAKQAFALPFNPNFITTGTFTSLDIAPTALTVATTDDGAYLTGSGPICIGGLYVFAFGNVSGTGAPLSVNMTRQAIATHSTSPTDNLVNHPASVRAILGQIAPSTTGDYALVIPIGANNPNGVRRIELRDAQNNLVSAITDADGNWPGGANTTASTRRSVVSLSPSDGALAPDADGDGICDDDDNCVDDANPGQEDGDFDGVGDACDVCPSLANAEPGDACDDGFAATVLDVIGAGPGCACAGVPCTTDIDFVYQSDGTDDLFWELRQQGSNILVQNGGGSLVGTGTQGTCLPDGCFYLVVTDDGGDGIVDGGYILKINSAQRLIDNRYDEFGRGGFTSGATSQIAGGEGFCLPIGTDRLITSACDRHDWRTTCTPEYVVANGNALVTAQYNVTNNTSGYQMWWYNPNGGYSFKRIQYHSTLNGLVASATRAAHFRINAWGGNQLVDGTFYNVKVRGIVNTAFQPWGAACRFMINNTEANCPRTKLYDQSNAQFLSCNQTKAIAGNVYVYANPVRRLQPGCASYLNANRYQFRFRIVSESFELIKTSATGQYLVNTIGLSCGKTYEVDVRASFNNGDTWCHTGSLWGDVCTLSTPACPPAQGGNQNMAQEGGASELRMYPNPNRGDQLFVNLTGIDASVETVSVDIFDAFGKRVSARTIATQDGFVNTIMQLNGELAAGLYTVSFTAGEQQFNERLVVQP